MSKPRKADDHLQTVAALRFRPPLPCPGDGRRGDYDGVSLRTGEADKASEAVFVIDESETGRVANSQIGIKRVL
jgi:hypothetical protein